MNYLHYEVDAGPEDIVEVTLNRAANVQMMDAANFEDYKARREYRYYGGHAEESPVRLRPPRPGLWHLAIDPAGEAGRLRASVRALRGVAVGSPA